MKLSIILPVYNVEPYLERCLRSLLEQDIPHEAYEIIVVNDGSPDNSREVAVRMMKEYANIVLIDQENKGVSMARNAGIDRATGDYLLFVDPDDYVLPRTFESFLSLAIASQAEVAFLGFQILSPKGTLVTEVLNREQANGVYSGHQAYRLSRGNGKLDPDRTWGVAYHRMFLEQFSLRYIADVPYLEDGEFIARTMSVASRCVFLGAPFYMRTTRPGSATNSNLFVQERSIRGFVKAACSLRDFSRSQMLNADQRIFLNQPILKFSMLAIQACVSRSSFRKLPMVAQLLSRNDLVRLSLEGCQGIYLQYGRLYNISLYLFFLSWALRMLVARMGLLNR